ncbi:hypothetical protein BDD43_3306 [Mucilaginibacter gracilis]|uniref:Uncharacterized protein n=1 Tax=Mucilaginibacter gracilis TaxID=423350 RepID=A0A495J2A8_9SPHI|nr:hypothetical protein BDD43_3306 [Mucilaginibacter gracilis]
MTFYNCPSKQLLSKYGFKRTRSDNKNILCYKSNTIQPNTKTSLTFIEGMIVVEDFHKINDKTYNRIRLNRITVNSNDELDIILRQTYPLFMI